MPPSSQDNLDKLTDTLNNLMIETGKSEVRMEERWKSVVSGIDKLADTVTTAVESNNQMKLGMQKLEMNAIHKVELFEDTINTMSGRVDIFDKRIVILELINANHVGGLDQQKKDKEHWAGTYGRIVITLSILLAASTFIYNVFFKSTGVTG